MRAVFTSPQARRRTVGWLLISVAAVFGSAVLVGRFLPWFTDPAALRAEFEAAGPFASAAFVLTQAIQVIIAPIPGHALGFVSGYLFGALYGTVHRGWLPRGTL